MKKTILTLCLTFSMLSTIIAQTTNDEYNYSVRGYQIQIESGLDMKKGYEIQEMGEYLAGTRYASLKKLLRVKNNRKEIACYILYYEKSGAQKEYICIPHPDSDPNLFGLYWKKLYNGSTYASERLQLLLYLTTKYLNWN